ncbi:MAG: hypothetical protein K6F53_08280, partial [Lachnospiraceae bacterium]|nr:hypothetical protein [Lachnospiraceae bacterium]
PQGVFEFCNTFGIFPHLGDVLPQAVFEVYNTFGPSMTPGDGVRGSFLPRQACGAIFAHLKCVAAGHF